jgi:hypothetical protein
MKFFKIFSKKRKDKKSKEENPFFEEIKLLENYNYNNFCDQCKYKDKKYCNNSCNQWKKFFNQNKKNNFLIIDDNKGIITLIKELIYELYLDKKIDLEKWNIIPFYDNQASVFLLKAIFNGELKNVKAALIDITYRNILRIENKNIKINGIHLAYFLKKFFPEIKFYFYTGNTLNEYIKSQKFSKEFFEKTFGQKIDNFIINKMNTSDEELKNFIIKLIKDK